MVGAYLFVLTIWAGSRYENQLRRPASILIGLYAIQLVLGLVNVTLLAPLWMQMLHLFVSDLVWICLVLFSLAVFNQALVHVSKPAFPVAEQAGQ
jgi:heme A synthase